MFTNSDIAELTALRRELHLWPELSGAEEETARRVVAFMTAGAPDKVLTGLGGTGVALVYDSGRAGPSVMIRAELDALPIEETGTPDYRSRIAGRGHLCGHDGHMAMLCAVGRVLARQRPARGRVILLFQPAEETGQGAAAVLADPAFAAIAPDIALSLHNMPGLPLGHVGLAEGPANCASRGLDIRLCGRTAHASMPDTGLSPMRALARLMPALTALGGGGPLDTGFRMATVTHAALGEATFGVAPGAARLMVTLRCLEDAGMDALCAEAEALVRDVAEAEGLELSMRYDDVFLACRNAPEAVALLRRACTAAGVPVSEVPPMLGSEDFGRFGHDRPAAMFLLGAGEDRPQLHNPDYDFPDDLIPVGAAVFLQAIREVLG